MSDPVEWLSEKLTEAEALARKTMRGGSPIDDEEESHWYVAGSGMVRNDTERITDLIHIHDAPHIALWDPAMVLQLVAATRALLELHRLEWNHDYAIVAADGYVTGFSNKPTRSWPVCSDCGTGDPFTPEDWPCPTMRAVAIGWGWVDE